MPLRRNLIFRRVAPAEFRLTTEAFEALKAAGEEQATAAEAGYSIVRPIDLSPRDWAIFLLHSAAEVEHALMVQYLFAAYSLKGGEQVAEGVFTDDWRNTLIDIARQEMGHLLTVQNLLRLVGGPVCFEREDFPLRTMFYPFPFVLERLTRDSLAKYVFAEMSPADISEDILSAAERDAITERAKKAAGPNGTDGFINHVGSLYNTLREVFEAFDENEFPDPGAWQSLGWGGTTEDISTTLGLKLLPARNRNDAIDAIDAIAQQGEASTTSPSHFVRLLRMYRQCPEDADRLTLPFARNPTTRGDDPDATLITNKPTTLWAELFNTRYRMVLVALQHATMADPATQTPDGEAVRDVMRGWVYEEMKSQPGSLSELARQRLGGAPVGDAAKPVAGPPFSLPYTLIFPDREKDRWLLHRDLVDNARQLLDQLAALLPDDTLIPRIIERDALRREFIQTVLSP